MKLVMLGTAGGPRPSKVRSAPAQAIVYEDEIHVVDCGNGVARQMVKAGLPLDKLDSIYVTHHHADHMLDLGALPLTAWTEGLSTSVDIYGPPGTREAVQSFLAMVNNELKARVSSTGRTELAPLLSCRDLHQAGRVRQSGGLQVTSALVNHPPFDIAYGYRFDGEGQAIVFSGDTTYSENLVELACGADILVHEAFYEPEINKILCGAAAKSLREHIYACHTKAEDAGRVAREAGVEMLVLTHLVPYHPSITDDMWRDAAASQFDGEIVVGRDLLELNLSK